MGLRKRRETVVTVLWLHNLQSGEHYLHFRILRCRTNHITYLHPKEGVTIRIISYNIVSRRKTMMAQILMWSEKKFEDSTRSLTGIRHKGTANSYLKRQQYKFWWEVNPCSGREILFVELVRQISTHSSHYKIKHYIDFPQCTNHQSVTQCCGSPRTVIKAWAPCYTPS